MQKNIWPKEQFYWGKRIHIHPQIRTQNARATFLKKLLAATFMLIVSLTSMISPGKQYEVSLVKPAMASGGQIYWGGYLDGDQYGYGDAPWDSRTIQTFEQHAGKAVSIIHWGQFWHWGSQSGYPGIGDGYFQKFDTNLYENVRQHGSIPMINWNSWDGGAGGSSNQPDYQLADITGGKYDAYIRQWARDAKAWGKPFFLRFNHEMNGDWYPWSELTNGNQRGEYVQMWRHVHDLFVQEGATNVSWVWSVNNEYPSSSYSSELESLYPGDAYVDWIAIDAYNWGTNPAKPDSWKSFSQVVSQTYNHLGQIAPNKPVMLSEFASTEYGGSKADWIKDALSVQIPNNFPRIQAVVWFNYNAYEGSGKMDWVIESSTSAQSAFANGIGSSYYAANDFANLSSSPIPALSPTGSPPPTPVPPPPTPTPQPGTSNLIQNASFEVTGSAWLSPWNAVVGSGAAGSILQDGGTRLDGTYSVQMKVTTSAPTAPWGVQVNQRNMSISAGSPVDISFWAKASAPREIQVVVQLGASPYTEYVRKSFTLGTSWQQYSFSYTQPSSTTNAQLAFNAAQATGQVWLDQVSLSTGSAMEVDAPYVRVTFPATGQPVTKKTTIVIKADATDNVGVDRVEFLVTGRSTNFSCVDRQSPYECTWKVPGGPSAQFTIRATAYDAAGNSSSDQITVTSK